MFNSEALVGLPGYEVTGICQLGRTVRVCVRYVGESCCPFCLGQDLSRVRKKANFRGIARFLALRRFVFTL